MAKKDQDKKVKLPDVEVTKKPPPTRPPKGDKTTLGFKLCQVLAEIHKIPKEGHNPHFHYDYVREDTLTEQIRPLLAKHGIALVFGAERCEDLNPGDDRGTWTRVWCRFTLFDVDGNEFSVLCPGEGTDARHPDKALYKAMTGATKYFLYKTFLVSTGDDPERDDKVEDTRQATRKDPKEQTEMMTSDQREELGKFAKRPRSDFTDQLNKIMENILDKGGTKGSAERVLAECKRQAKTKDEDKETEEKSKEQGNDKPKEDPPDTKESDEEIPF